MEEQYNPAMDDAATAAQLAQSNATQAQSQYYMQEQELNLAEAQLECETTLTMLYHQLRQDERTITEQGTIKWEVIKDVKKRRLTDDGVNRIME